MQMNLSVFLNLGFGEQLWMYKCQECAIELIGFLFYLTVTSGPRD